MITDYIPTFETCSLAMQLAATLWTRYSMSVGRPFSVKWDSPFSMHWPLCFRIGWILCWRPSLMMIYLWLKMYWVKRESVFTEALHIMMWILETVQIMDTCIHGMRAMDLAMSHFQIMVISTVSATNVRTPDQTHLSTITRSLVAQKSQLAAARFLKMLVFTPPLPTH